MRLLIIGGTRFSGHALTEMALAAGHDVTLFNRGESEPGAFPGAEHLVGDRDGGIDAVRGREFDAVVDTCGYFPRVVGQSVDALDDTVGTYLFVSSISVYVDGVSPGYDEDTRVRTLDGPIVEEITDETYGALKALCEEEVRRGFGDRALIVRPGLIVGPRDRSDRFTWLVRRVARGGTVLAPGVPERTVQFVDARDLAAWMLRMVERRASGVFNATGPAEPLAFGEVLETIRRVSGSDATFEWVPDDDFLLGERLVPWFDYPLWTPAKDAAADACDTRRAIAAGLTFRPLERTIADTLAWDRARPQHEPMNAGLSRDREREVLERWRLRQLA